MNVVLYTTSLEPITVIDMPIELKDSIEKYGLGRIRVTSRNPEVKAEELVIYLYRLKDKRGTIFPFFITAHEELALSLVPQQLPGQLALHQQMLNLIDKQRAVIDKLK